MAAWLEVLGHFCANHAKAVILAWAALLIVALAASAELPNLLFSGSGDIPGSMSLRVDRLLDGEFAHPRSQLAILAVRCASLEDQPDAFAALLSALKSAYVRDAMVTEALAEADLGDRRLTPGPASGHIVLISLRGGGVRDAEQAIPRLRTITEALLRRTQGEHPDLQWALTGRAALTFDLNRFNAEDTRRAELRVLPITLLILVVAFGSLAAAALPVILGVTATGLTLGLVAALAHRFEFSNLVENVASMVGLALGIDYSLFIIHRYRQERARLTASQQEVGETDLHEPSLAVSMRTAGSVVVYSGLTVLIGMAGLLATPLMETRSIGAGGCIVVLMAVAVAVTLLPAALTWLGPAALEWPRALSNRLQTPRTGQRWSLWADAVLRRPVWSAVLSLAAILLLASPGLATRFGFPEARFLPAELEYTRGLQLLSSMGLKGLLSPLPIVLNAEDGGEVLTAARLPALLELSRRLHRDPRVAAVLGPVDLDEGMTPEQYTELYSNERLAFTLFPRLENEYLSRDHKYLLMQALPSQQGTLAETKDLARTIFGWKVPGMQVQIGGQAQYYNDFDFSVSAAYSRSVALVLLATAVVLLAVFRAPLVTIKALLLNALSVLAGYGALVYVFQLGHGSQWLGVAGPTDVVPLTIPLLIYCILFGLSMDYEVLLLSRARSAFLETRDNRLSIRAAVVDTASVITNAALIMFAVFGAFAFARVVLVQMLGLGLAVAVFVDAFLIRCLLAPALMILAGRWNWWPASQAQPINARRVIKAPIQKGHERN